MPDDLLSSLAARLRASPAELAGLAVLLAGVVAVAVLATWTRTGGAGPVAAVPVAGSVLAPSDDGTGPGDVTVHLAGAVVTPGVLTLPAGSRVADAVRAAGGVTPDADPDALNLARELIDGERVVVPLLGAPSLGASAGTETDGDGPGDGPGEGRIDLNRATATELEALPGVGPVLAGRIVAHREEHGPFAEVGQLRDVPGIGERTFQSLAELVTVG
ncbi:MAG: ComEA family DNA-binding protein [Actinobacteria bacterium]|nr:ComEA family DNA-binding protein [Actinomycetota bacterium]